MLTNLPVVKAEVLVLGDRNYPVHPTIRIPALLTAPLAGLLTTAQSRVPDVTYDDLIKAIWSVGVHHVTVALDAGLLVERQGVIKQPPIPLTPQGGPKGAEAVKAMEVLKAAKQAGSRASVP